MIFIISIEKESEKLVSKLLYFPVFAFSIQHNDFTYITKFKTEQLQFSNYYIFKYLHSSLSSIKAPATLPIPNLLYLFWREGSVGEAQWRSFRRV